MVPAKVQRKNGLEPFSSGIQKGPEVVRRIGDWDIQDFIIEGPEGLDQRGVDRRENEAVGLQGQNSHLDRSFGHKQEVSRWPRMT